MNTSPNQPSLWETLQRLLPIVLTIFIGIGLSISIYTVAQHWEQERLEIEFQKAAEDRALAIQRALDFNLDLLKSFEAFFQANQQQFDSKTFNTLAKHFSERYSFLQSLQWVPRVSHSQRQTYEARRQKVLAEFNITELNTDTKLVPAKTRFDYFPIDEIQPLTGNALALGFDLGSHPKLKSILKLAQDTGEMQAIPHTTLVEHTNLHGLIVVLPLYQDANSQLQTATERQAALSGFVLGIYHMGEILDKEVMHYLEARPIDIRIYQQKPNNEQEFIHFYAGQMTDDMLSTFNENKDNLTEQEKNLKYINSFKTSGLDLQVVCTPAPNYLQMVSNQFQALVVLILGLFVTLLLAGYFHISMRHAYHLAEAAESANKAQTNFLASMSHQMRTPINAITGYIELLMEEARELEESGLKQDIEKVYISARYLLSLSEGILDLFKIKSGRIELRRETCEVTGLVRDIEDIAMPLVQKNQNHLVIDCPGADVVGAMNTDITRLHQILLNLLNHLAEHTHHEEIRLTVSRETLEGFEWICFAVSGRMEISLHEQETLQQKLRRAETSTSDEQAGLRMGLVISAHLWHMLDGRISVKLDGDVTYFILHFPAMP